MSTDLANGTTDQGSMLYVIKCHQLQLFQIYKTLNKSWEKRLIFAVRFKTHWVAAAEVPPVNRV